jgi:hypothetical protein
VPSAIKHDHEFSSKGLVTILVERQGAEQDNLESFLWKTFPDSECFSCVGGSVFVPIPESKGIPHSGVIGVDGTLLWAGNPLSAPKQIEDLLEAELVKVKKGWGATPDARKVRAALYGKGDFTGAQAAITALPEGEERTALQAELDKRYGVLKQAVTNLRDQGQWLAAQEAALELQKGVAGGKQVSEVAALVAEFDTDAAKAEIAMDKKLDKIVKQLRDKKTDNAKKALQSLVKGAGATKVGERAKHLQMVLDTKVE